MSFYPRKINERFQHPKNVGELGDTEAIGTGASFVCGTFVRVYLTIDTKTKEILDAKFKSNGCGFSIAAADILTEQIVGKRLNEVHSLDRKILTPQIEAELEVFLPPRKHCLELCLDAMQAAFAAFRSSLIEEFSGEKAIICTCFGVSEETIEDLVKKNSLENVMEVTNMCGAGGGCGSCQPLIQEIVDILQRESYATMESY